MPDMEKKITYVKDGILHIRVDTEDLYRWKARADKLEVTLTAYVIAVLNGSLGIVTGRKRA